MDLTMNLALLILRLVTGLTLAAHGSQKLFGWFGGAGFDKTRAGFEKQGLKPGWLWAGLASLGEVGGGLSIALGFLTPLGAAGIFGAMVMAVFKTHWKNGFFNQNRGYEYALTQLVVSVFIGLVGPGGYSLDALLSFHLPQAGLFLLLAIATVIVDLTGLRLSQAAQSSSPAGGPPSSQKS